MRAGMALAGRGKRSWVALLPRLVDDMQSLTIEGEDSCQWWAMGVVSRRAVIVAHREVAAVSAAGIGARAGCDMRSERGQRRRRTCRSLRGASRRSHPRAEPRVRRDLFLRLRYRRGGGRRGEEGAACSPGAPTQKGSERSSKLAHAADNCDGPKSSASLAHSWPAPRPMASPVRTFD